MPIFTDEIPDVDTRYARDISFPLRFGEDCDLLMDEDQEIIDQSLQLITMVPSSTIRLFPQFGSAVSSSVFDPLDEETELIIDTSMRTAFEALEPRVFLDREFTFDQTPDESKLIVIVPYSIKITGALAATKFVIDRPLNPG